ncbi:P-II family nitrogen regulator [Ruminiclostridium herbifermentans]
MENIPDNKSNELELLFLIVNDGMGSKVVKSAKQKGVSGGTVFLGKGTSRNHLLKLLDLSDIKKEIALMIGEKTVANNALIALDKEFRFDKPHHGIAFSVPVSGLFGTRNCSYYNNMENRGVKNTMHKAIFVIVDKGKAESVIDAAIKAGSRGGTIINSRGSGIHETSRLFSMEIEPEREIVLIVAETSKVEPITTSIRSELKLDDPGNGILFIIDVNETYGLY